jgi:arsenate reductase (thioredoxin)
LKKVLFVCVENSCRSQMAEAFLNIHGGRNIQAFSAGSRPSGVVNHKAIASMREVGYDLSVHHSTGLCDVPDTEYDYAITMGCGDDCPMVKAKCREDWRVTDPKNMAPEEFGKVRDLIEEKVKELIAKV